MKNDESKCSLCGIISEEGLNFCGGCGQKLNKACSNCESVNPPTFKFCGHCGQDLRLLGTLILDSNGLITKADKTAHSIFQIEGRELLGKPFSIFVNVTDRAFFFSCWNKVLNTSAQQDLEVELNPEPNRTINSHLFLKPQDESNPVVNTVYVEIEDITEPRQALQQSEENEKLLEIIDSLTETFHPAKRKTRHKTINGVLEKIGLVSLVQYAFVSRIDLVSKLLFTDFKWQGNNTSQGTGSIPTIPMDTIQPVLDKLEKGTVYSVEDFNMLSLAECQLWEGWHPHFSPIGSVACELIYRDNAAVGIIGFIRTEKGTWPRNSLMLMKLSAQLISETLPRSLSARSILHHPTVSVPQSSLQDVELQPDKDNGFGEIEVIIDDVDEVIEDIEDIEKVDDKMLIEPNNEGDPDSAQRVFATNEGSYVLQCPQCARNELVATDHFKKSGWILKVTCPCSCSFRIIREMRKAYRKEVRLSGSFAIDSGGLNKLSALENWLSMEITNISKGGLNFKTPMTRLLNKGDTIKLRFALDNSKKSLIKTSAIIKSVGNNTVGCQFLNTDEYDSILGFYFL